MENVGLNAHHLTAKFSTRAGAEHAAVYTGQTPPQATQLSSAIPAVQDSTRVKPPESDDASRTDKAEKDAANGPAVPGNLPPDPIPAELSAAERSAAYAQLGSPEATDKSGEAVKLFLVARNLFAE